MFFVSSRCEEWNGRLSTREGGGGGAGAAPDYFVFGDFLGQSKVFPQIKLRVH